MTPATPVLGRPVKITATLGRLTASLTGTAADGPMGTAFANATLKVVDGGSVLWQGTVKPADPAVVVMPMAIGPRGAELPVAQSLCLARLAGGEQPKVLLGLYTGGMHCCTVVRMSRSADGSSAFVERNLGNAPPTLLAEGDHIVLLTSDDAFNYAFTDYARSATPIQVLEVQHGQFVDTTRHYQGLIATDADKWFNLMSGDSNDILGVLAAWTADECMAGLGPQAWATIDQLQRQGKVRPGALSMGGAPFVPYLHQFLGEHGYCS